MTVKELSATEAIDFIQALAHGIEKSPTAATLSVQWIKAALLAHASFIMSQPKAKQQLQPVQALLKAKLSNRDALLRVRGNLEALTISREHAQREGQKSVLELQEPLIDYQEGDEKVVVPEEGSSDEDEDEAKNNDDDGEFSGDFSGDLSDLGDLS
uniref:Small-subunit processome Utp12 domain-containing protein n=1 Tax=Oxyrrhis marina TaxID=2969 RepID=A0A7S3UJC9_OXYMA